MQEYIGIIPCQQLHDLNYRKRINCCWVKWATLAGTPRKSSALLTRFNDVINIVVLVLFRVPVPKYETRRMFQLCIWPCETNWPRWWQFWSTRAPTSMRRDLRVCVKIRHYTKPCCLATEAWTSLIYYWGEVNCRLSPSRFIIYFFNLYSIKTRVLWHWTVDIFYTTLPVSIIAAKTPSSK